MTNIVLVGCGCQGLRHLRCLAKAGPAFDVRIVGIVDCGPARLAQARNLMRELGLIGPVRYRDSLESLALELDLSDVVVDVVTTNSTHHEVASTAAALGAKGVIVEKPIADTLEHARRIKDLDCPVYVVENYLFSRVTRFAKHYLRESRLEPCVAITEFSKDRQLDSFNGRGMLDGYTPHVFTIEIPHQIAVSSQLLGHPRLVYDAWCADMVLPGRFIPDHGQGAITLHHGGGTTSYNFSCLQGDQHTRATLRSARVYCQDGTEILCRYPIGADLIGSVLVHRGHELIDKRVFVDDSLTETLRYILARCEDSAAAFNDARFGYAVMEVIDTGKRLAREHLGLPGPSAESFSESFSESFAESRVTWAIRSTRIGR